MVADPLHFSVIVPTYSRPAALTECLESLANLDYPRQRFEVIVVDDGGDQPLDRVVLPFRERLELQLLRQENQGAASARNAAAAIARGTFLAFTDDDCRPVPEWLLALKASFRKTPDRLLGGRTINRLRDNPYSTASQLIVDAAYAYYNHNPDDAMLFASNNMAVPAGLFREVGGFDPEFRLASEDREFCDRWRHLGYRLTYVPRAVVHHGHRLSMRRYCRQHFNYGRGAWRYHHVRSRRGSGRLRNDLQFHGRFLKLLREPMSQFGFTQAAQITGLLLVWQLANAAGFFYEKYCPDSRDASEDRGPRLDPQR
jgi:GT2 family glycosyltransferase